MVEPNLVAFISIRRKDDKLESSVDIQVRSTEEAIAVMKVLSEAQKQVIAKTRQIVKV